MVKSLSFRVGGYCPNLFIRVRFFGLNEVGFNEGRMLLRIRLFLDVIIKIEQSIMAVVYLNVVHKLCRLTLKMVAFIRLS